MSLGSVCETMERSKSLSVKTSDSHSAHSTGVISASMPMARSCDAMIDRLAGVADRRQLQRRLEAVRIPASPAASFARRVVADVPVRST